MVTMMRKRVAVIDREKCFPDKCGNYLCAKLCPVNRSGADCIYPGDDPGRKARIDEMLCVSCGICPARCPFGAITIINLPEQLNKEPIHRYGENMFELFSLPTPKFNSVTGIVGKNGIGKSTALKILGNLIKPNLGKWKDPADLTQVLAHFKGTEMQKFMEKLHKNEITLSYKPQQVDLIPRQYTGTVRELLQKVSKNSGNGSEKEGKTEGEKEHERKEHERKREIDSLYAELQLTAFLDNPVSAISGGELQRVAIAAAALKKANLYLFDEPTSYLDIRQRLRASHFIRSLVSEQTASEPVSVLAIEHDLVILDFMTDFLNVMYGHEGAYGVVSCIKSSREGINAFLDGYLREENMRFRDHAVKFERQRESLRGIPAPALSWDSIKLKQGNFHLETARGTLHKNEVVGVLGENGTGKTTFMKLLAGLLQPDEGALNKEVRVAYKPQYLESGSEAFVSEFLQKALEKYQHQLITPLGIDSLLTRKLQQLSGGELQRVAITYCLSQDAEVFLLDEPSAYLDVEQRLLISKLIRSLAEERGVTILVVDHDLMFLDYLSDRLIVFTGEPARKGMLQGPFSMEEGMNLFLQNLGITLRRDLHSHRPRINKPGSVKDREQKEGNKWYYS